MNAIVPSGGNGFGLIPQNIADAMRLAEMMAKGKMVPEHLRNAADMLMVIEQACRWGMSPFAVAQCTAVVRGHLSYEGKLVAAAINTSGILQGRLDYEFSGEGAGRAVTARGTLRGETKPREVVVTLASAKTDNEHWKKSPDQMLTYHAARVWARRYTPEVMLGVYSPEEFDAPPPRAYAGPTIDGNVSGTTAGNIPGELPNVAQPTPSGNVQPPDLRDAINKEVPLPPRRTARAWLDELRHQVALCASREEIEELAGTEQVTKALAHFKNGALEELNSIMADGMARFEAAADEDIFPGDRP